MRVILGISGATGSIYGIRLLEVLRDTADVEVHLVLSKWAEATICLETPYKIEEIKSWAKVAYPVTNQAAAISSGSFPVDAMVVAPCSMHSLAAIRMGLSDNLLTRAADVTLKEGRKLVLVPRESPLSAIHLENMLALSRLGVVMLPPMPAFYHKVETVEDLIDHTVARILDHLHIDHQLSERWPTGK